MKTATVIARAATWILGLVACLLASANRVTMAEGPLPTCEADCPILSKIPYVDRLFKNCCPPCTQELIKRPIRPGECGRVAVDFDFDIEAPCASACSPTADCCRTNASSGLDIWCQAMVEATSSAIVDVAERERGLIESLIALTQQAASATARLEALKESSANEAKLRQELMDARISNAQLVAKLKMSEEKLELAARLQQAQLEIADLKIKLAQAKSPAGQTQGKRPQVAESYHATPQFFRW